MKLSRRHFLAWAGLGALGAVACEGFGIREGELDIQSPVSLPEDLVRGKDNWYASLCRTCPSCEGILVRVMEGRAKKVQGNPLYPVNQGKTSAGCEAGVQALYHPDRISGPMRRGGNRGSGRFDPIDWEPEGMSTLVRQLTDRGSRTVMLTKPTRGHLGLLTSRFANAVGAELMAFEAIDNNVYRDAVRNVYQQSVLPDLDVENANFILSFGADFLSTWVSPTRWGVGYGEFRQGESRESRGTLYQIDSRFSMTAANADKWVPINPGWEGHLALSIAQVIVDENLQATGVDVDGLLGPNGRDLLNNYRPENVAGDIGLTSAIAGGDPAEFIRKLARDFATHGPSIAIAGGSAGAHSNGLFNVEAATVLNWLVGSVGAQGGVRLNPDGPWQGVPASAAASTLDDFERLGEQIRTGETRMLLIHNVDPVHGLPGSVKLRDAIESAQDLFVISFSPFIDETTAMADLLLPDRVYLEDWGDDIPEPGPGYQVVGMQQPVVNPLSDLDPRSFGDLLLSMAQEMGQESALPWGSVEAALKESVEALYNLNRGTSSEVASAGELWNLMLQQGGWWSERDTGSNPGAARTDLLNLIAGRGKLPDFSGSGNFYLLPFAHNSLLDGRNAHLPWMQAAPDPITTVTWQTWVEVNSRKASELGLREGDIVRIESDAGSITALVYPNPALPPNVVAVPLGQGRRNGSPYASGGDPRESSNVMDLLSSDGASMTETGALAWAAHRVRVVSTGESLKVSKYEGIFPAREIAISEGEEIIKVTDH
jgi:anaerobic selenocysteine-containing dehydrogenase